MIRHVAHIVWGFRLGGIETMLVNIMNEQVACGIDVTLIIINNIIDEQLTSKIDSRVKIVYIGREAKSRNIYPIFKLNATLLKANPTVIHCHSHTIIKYLLPTLHRRSIVTIHNTTVVKERTHINKFSKVFVISNAVRSELADNFGVESKVVYNGVDFSKIAMRTMPIERQKLNIVQVGRLTKQKGHYISIETMAALRELNIHLDIIGDGKLREELEEMISQTGLTDRITLLGAKSQEYIFAHLKDYDLLIQPSVWEGFGLTAVEAMAAKVPVLASNIDGLGEILQNGKYGECFESGNVEQCRDKIIELYNAPYKAERLDAIYDYANANFNVKHTANRYLDLYAKI